MSELSVWRQRARALLPGECFLRRDQQLRALFVTDFPRRNVDCAEKAKALLQENGFTVTESKGMWQLDLNPDAQAQWIATLPQPEIPEDFPLEIASLCRSLLSCGVTDADKQPWEAIKWTLLRLDGGEVHLLIPELRALCAKYKRLKAPLPTAVVSLFTLDKEAFTC